MSDYDSEEIHLDDPSIYRNLHHPMGAQSEARAIKFQDRYEAVEMTQGDDGHPPFHYGTHSSCAAYALHYLISCSLSLEAQLIIPNVVTFLLCYLLNFLGKKYSRRDP